MNETEPAGIEPMFAPAWRQAPVVSGAPQRAAARANGDGPLVRVEIPADIEQLSMGEAREWRMTTRSAFVQLLNHGYGVIGFYTENRKRCYYVLARTGAANER